jgi:hypothetical protein
MGANTHPTTRVETDDDQIRGERLKNDLQALDSVESARLDVIAPSGVVFETGNRGLTQEIISVLHDHEARLRPEHDPWEAFV